MPKDILGRPVVTAAAMDEMARSSVRTCSVPGPCGTCPSCLPTMSPSFEQPRNATSPPVKANLGRGRPARWPGGPATPIRPTKPTVLGRPTPPAGADRGPAGEPSRVDFELHDLVMILATFANDWDDLPRPIVGRDDYRVLVEGGVLVRSYAVHADWPETASSNCSHWKSIPPGRTTPTRTAQTKGDAPAGYASGGAQSQLWSHSFPSADVQGRAARGKRAGGDGCGRVRTRWCRSRKRVEG